MRTQVRLPKVCLDWIVLSGIHGTHGSSFLGADDALRFHRRNIRFSG